MAARLPQDDDAIVTYRSERWEALARIEALETQLADARKALSAFIFWYEGRLEGSPSRHLEQAIAKARAALPKDPSDG